MPTGIVLHIRLIVAACIGIGIGLFLPGNWSTLVRAICGWDVAVTIYVVLVSRLMFVATTETMRQRAEQQDESGWTLLGVSGAVATFGLCASLGLLSGFKDLPPSLQPIHLGLAIFTIVGSWFFLHLLFALHYAGEYYAPGAADKERGGLQFPNKDEPGYVEFLYYSLTIGMTAQTSDTCVSSSNMRLLTMGHSVLTFFFNTVVVALSINIAASLL